MDGWVGRWMGEWMDGWVGAERLERCVNSLARLLDVSELIKTSGHFVEKRLSYSRASYFQARNCFQSKAMPVA